MLYVQRTFPGVSLLVDLNLDRFFAVGTVVIGLLAGALLGDFIISP